MRKAIGGLFILAIVVSLAVVQRSVLLDIWQRLIDLPLVSLFPLALAAAVMIVARGAFLAACSPGINLRQAISADQTALAAGYGIAIGGGLVGTGTRIHMFTRWGMPQSNIATSIVATAVVPAFSTWSLPVVVLAIPVLVGKATSTEILAVVAGVLIVIFSGAFWWAALRSPFLFSLLGRFGSWLRLLLARKVSPRFVRTQAFIERSQPTAFFEEMRAGLIELLRLRWGVIFATSIATLAAGFCCMWTASVVFGVSGLTFSEALVAFSLVRVVIALSPIPGGAGIAELGLIALLERAGVSGIDATGTTLLYRFLTWFLPMIVGSLLWWQYSRADKSLQSVD
ncbi:MAG: lysylphosphatidylglycerol synthase domain-containing protein [Actinomycetes bacterium]